jgi:putative membrane protein
MKTTAIALACAMFAAPAFAQSVTEKTGVNSALGISPSTADFIKEAAISDMFEIQSSQLALQQGDASTKAFATQMIADHKKTTSELESIVQNDPGEGSLPTQLDSTHQQMLDKLKGLHGQDFTRQYDSDQVSGHQDAVSLFQRYGKGGDVQALKIWASKTLPTLEHHLQMAQALKA